MAVENDIAKGRRIMSALMPFMRTLEQGGKLIQPVRVTLPLPARTFANRLGEPT